MSEPNSQGQTEGSNPAEKPKSTPPSKVECRICGKKVNPAGLPRHEWSHIPDIYDKMEELENKIAELKAVQTQPAPAVPSTSTQPNPGAAPATVKVKDVKPLLDTVLEHVKSCPECRRELGEWLTQNTKQFAEWFVPEDQRKRLRL